MWRESGSVRISFAPLLRLAKKACRLSRSASISAAPQGGSSEKYFFGSFDGKNFIASTEAGAHGWTNYGKEDYCAISYNGLPQGERLLLIGWMSNWQYAPKIPTQPWRGQMSLPRRLSFVRDADGLAFKQEPVIAPLHAKSFPVAWPALGNSSRGALGESAIVLYELELQFGHPGEPIFGVRLYSDEQHWTEIGFDTNKEEFYIDRTRSGAIVSGDFPARTRAPLAADRPACRGSVQSRHMHKTARLPWPT
jgi:fructan beta-fructosidase